MFRVFALAVLALLAPLEGGGVMFAAKNIYLGRCAKPSTPTAKSYVQDGLIAMWDGIENAGWGVHDAAATTWKNLISNNDLGPTQGMWSDDGLICTGGMILLVRIEDSVSTLEIVCSTSRVNTAQLVFNARRNPSGNFDAGFSFRGNNTVNFYDGGPCFLASNPTGINSYAYVWTGSVLYENGAVKTSLGSGATFRTSYNGISTRSEYPYHGKICRIGCYSRALTAEEIAANYAIDKERFNLP